MRRKCRHAVEQRGGIRALRIDDIDAQPRSELRDALVRQAEHLGIGGHRAQAAIGEVPGLLQSDQSHRLLARDEAGLARSVQGGADRDHGIRQWAVARLDIGMGEGHLVVVLDLARHQRFIDHTHADHPVVGALGSAERTHAARAEHPGSLIECVEDLLVEDRHGRQEGSVNDADRPRSVASGRSEHITHRGGTEKNGVGKDRSSLIMGQRRTEEDDVNRVELAAAHEAAPECTAFALRQSSCRWPGCEVEK